MAAVDHRRRRGGLVRASGRERAVSIDHSELEGLSPEELEQKFLADANLFYGPDPEIMADHDISHRSPREEELLARPDDRELFALVRSKIQAGLNESFEMMEQMGA